MNSVLLSARGQITIPKPVRDKLGLRPGTVLQFETVNGQIVASKRVAEDVFKKWRGRGKLPREMTVESYLKRMRDAHGR